MDAPRRTWMKEILEWIDLNEKKLVAVNKKQQPTYGLIKTFSRKERDESS